MNWYSTLFYLFNIYFSIPNFGCAIYRLFHQDYYSSLKYTPRSTILDHVFRMLIVPLVLYYILDSVYILIQYERMDMCNFAFLLHHVLTLLGGQAMLTLPHYPWFIMSLFSWHTLLIVFWNLSILNYGYLTLAFITIYGLNQAPWKQNPRYYRVLFTLYTLFLLPIPIIWVFECRNDMENVL